MVDQEFRGIKTCCLLVVAGYCLNGRNNLVMVASFGNSIRLSLRRTLVRSVRCAAVPLPFPSPQAERGVERSETGRGYYEFQQIIPSKWRSPPHNPNISSLNNIRS
jgi:hypothetical protein